jgi:hypothetical protein
MNEPLRSFEWECACAQGANIRSGSLRRCPRCAVDRPDTAAIAAMEAESKRVLQALDMFDRLSPRVGRFQAMQACLREYGKGER